MNARHKNWGDSTNNQRGRYLISWLQSKALDYRARLYPPSDATFPSANSYLDICISDIRIELNNLINDKLRTLTHTSDHKAIQIEINLDSINFDPILHNKPTLTKNFKKTNWNKFKKHLTKNSITIPANINLTNNQIDNYIADLEKAITNAIEETVPTYKPTDSVTKYVNKKIVRRYNKKHKLISNLNYIKKKFNPKHLDIKDTINSLKEQIITTSNDLKKEFSIACNAFWANKAKLINYKNTESFFPQLNSMYRSKQLPIPTKIKIHTTNTKCIDRINTNVNELPIDDDHYILTDEQNVLSALGWHYEQVNASKDDNDDSPFTREINDTINKLISEIENIEQNNSTLTQFSDTDLASSPSYSATDNSETFYTTRHVTKV